MAHGVATLSLVALSKLRIPKVSCSLNSSKGAYIGGYIGY